MVKRRLRRLPVVALVSSMLLTAFAGNSGVGRSDGLTRVTSYFCPPNCGLTAHSGSVPLAGWTAGCAEEHLGQYVTLVYAGLTLYCDDTGDPGYFAEDSNRVDAYGFFLGEDYDYVIFSVSD